MTRLLAQRRTSLGPALQLKVLSGRNTSELASGDGGTEPNFTMSWVGALAAVFLGRGDGQALTLRFSLCEAVPGLWQFVRAQVVPLADF